MLFNSLHFLIFFPLVVIFYFTISSKWRVHFLLLSSYYFYMCWKPEYVILILGSTVVDFFIAKKIYKAKSELRKKQLLILSLIVNLGVLIFFKYFNFLSENIMYFFNMFNIFYEKPEFSFLLPVGISFYTFQTLSYTIDIYNKKIEPENNFFQFALFVSFFPQLVAGPIERAKNLLPQFKRTMVINYSRIIDGLRLILWGFFKKVVIADNISLLVTQIYNNPSEQNGITYLFAMYLFAIQIYCDFSGYSDIAIGSARVMGFNLMTNFKQPHLSKSIREFWSRWHISLSTWFKDYIYFPLGGNRTVKWRWYYNLFLTFLISGLWHGAEWTFVVWGALHGMFLILGNQIETFYPYKGSKLGGVFRIFFVFTLVALGLVIFRSPSISFAIHVLQNILSFPYLILDYFHGGEIFRGFGLLSKSFVYYLLFLVAFLWVVDWLSTKNKIVDFYYNHSKLRMASYFLLFYWILFGGYFGSTTFIYFQF